MLVVGYERWFEFLGLRIFRMLFVRCYKVCKAMMLVNTVVLYMFDFIYSVTVAAGMWGHDVVR